MCSAGRLPGSSDSRALRSSAVMRGGPALTAVAAALVLLLPGAAAATGDYFISSAGPYEGTRSSDGSSELTLSVTNASDREIRLTLRADDESCTGATGDPTVAPYRTAEVTFEMSCRTGAALRPATVSAEAVSSAGTPLTPTAISVQYRLTASPGSDWSRLWNYLRFGLPLALLGVIPPYLFWLHRPRGNPRPPEPGGSARREPPRAATDDPLLFAPWYNPRNLGLTLPGITSDWSFNDSWASNISLAAALFTTVFAGGDALDAIVGEAATGTTGVIAVAAAVSAGVIGSGPLCLTICKRRYEDEQGIARHNTVLGVLVASVVVLLGAIGLVLTAAATLQLGSAWALAVMATLVLLLYSWKSIPQTLALGRFAQQPVTAML